MNRQFQMVAKTFQGLEEVLAEELRGIGAANVQPGRRMVAFEGDLEMLYRANLCCRTALRILKPFYSFTAHDTDSLYESTKDFDWSQILTLDKTFAIDTVSNSDEFHHSQFVTYRVKDAIVDWFKDRYGADKRPRVRLSDADVLINVHISGSQVTLSLDSSGESLHKRGYRKAQTEAPINEVLAAGIILRSGWRGETPFVDPMCGSGTFLIEAALIAANINPGIYRRGFAFENWKDFDPDLLDRLYNDDSAEREVRHKIYGADISPRAIAIATENIKSAGVGRYIDLQVRPISQWADAPKPAGVIVTNPPYGERISAPDMDALYQTIGERLKHVFTGYHAWIIGYRDEYFQRIGLAPSERIPLLNGALECELREYVIFDGDRKKFVASGGRIGKDRPAKDRHAKDRPAKDRPARDSRTKDHAAKNHPAKDHPAKDRRPDRDFRRAGDDRKPRRDNDRLAAQRHEPEQSDNPLSTRRNENALRSIIGRQPALPPQEGPLIRPRGWKKRRDNADSED